jgi:hypothetical protein
MEQKVSAHKQKYLDYIRSEEWFNLKIDLLQKRGCNCERCGKKKHPLKLQIHHKTYERLFNERESDLIIVCRICHMKEHGLIKEPKIKKPKVKKKVKKPKKYSGLQSRDVKLQKRYDKLRSEGKIR